MRYMFLRFPEGKFKAVTLSYDDGDKSDLRIAKVLNEHKMKGTFNINSSWMQRETKLSPEELKEHLLDKGHEIAVHGAEHIAPGVARPEIVISDVLECRKTLERELSTIIRGMAYPDTGITKMHNGNNLDNIKGYLRSLGIVYSRTLGGDNNSFMLPSDFLAWMPTCAHRNPKLMDWVSEFVSLKEEGLYSSNRYPRLFYLWGHAFEFDRSDNWELLDVFCDAIAGKEDIWYATNIEIYEYVEAFNSLVTSADGRRIYNPTLKKIWMDIDCKPYSIGPGETITL